MKKIIYSAMVLGLVAGLSSCEDYRDDNPKFTTNGLSLELNKPVFADATLSLVESTSAMEFSWSANGYTFPYVTNYTFELATEESFKTVVYTAMTTSGSDKSLSPYDLNAKLETLLEWTPETTPSTIDIYARVWSHPKSAVVTEKNKVYSNVVKFTVAPTYIELKSAEPEMWFFLGDMFGGWTNAYDLECKTTVPMNLVPDCEYDKATGKGILTYTGWFEAGRGFKLLRASDGSWDFGFGGMLKDGKLAYRNGGDDTGNGDVPVSGYYTVTLDTKTYECTMVPYENPVSIFGTISLIGVGGDWNTDHDFSNAGAVKDEDGNVIVENHNWVLTVDLKTSDQVKIRADHGWDFNWGFGSEDGEVNAYGIGSGGGKNIGVAEDGTYVIWFNDITGFFRFQKK